MQTGCTEDSFYLQWLKQMQRNKRNIQAGNCRSNGIQQSASSRLRKGEKRVRGMLSYYQKVYSRV
jgi:hypothetical protein